MLIARLFFLTLILGGTAVADDSRLDRAVDAIFEPWNSLSTPGCAVGVAQDGQVVLSRAYGAADLEHEVANEPTTLFEVGSVSKQFTAAAILVLAQDGKLKLSDDVRKYIPELPDYGVPISIEHLLSHTSGIRDWGIVDELAGWGRTTRVMSNADVLDIIVRQQQLDFLPGDEFSYTNSGFVLLAIVAERVAGQSLQDFSREKLFEPFGMTSTQWRDDFRRVVSGRSIAYMDTVRGYVQTMPFENVYGDAGILTSVEDLLTWNAVLSERKLGNFVAAEFERRAVLNSGRQSDYSHGLYQRTYNDTAEISHAGGIGAYRAWLAFYPDFQLSIAVACNAGDPDYTFGGDYFGRKVADLFLPDSNSVHVRSGSNEIDVEAGLYVSEVTGMPTMLVHGEVGLVLGKISATALSEDRAILKNDNIMVVEGNDRYRIEYNTGNVEQFRKVKTWAPKMSDLDSFTGQFYSSEIGATYEIRKSDTSLVLHIKHRPDIAFELSPVYRDSFVYDIRLGDEGALVRFCRDELGNVNELGIGWRIGRVRDLRFKRLLQD
tara:strand:+ start:35168 stop:36808 length:1641 start_codon:yes stop_codon:yes gene_type:complete